MGCSRCAQIPQELVCLRCGQWAFEEGEKEHGKMVRVDRAEIGKKIAAIAKSIP